MGWTSGDRRRTRLVNPGRFRRRTISFACVAPDCAGRLDYPVSWLAVVSCGLVPVGVPLLDDPNSSDRISKGHLSAADSCIQAGQRSAYWASSFTAREM